MAKVSKRYAEAAKLVDRSKTYSIEEAVKLAKERPEILVDLEALEDGIMRTFVPQEIN